MKFDSEKAANFLMSRPGFPVLSFAHVDPLTRKKGAFETISFPHPIDRAALVKCLEARQGKANCYYSLNTLLRPMNKKAERTDIAKVVSFHIDLDPRAGESQEDAFKRCLAKLEAFRLPPSTIIASGGGIQAIWNLLDPIEVNGWLATAEEAKLYNVQLERELGGDNCHNIDRILRIPYTVNVADVKKMSKGRHDAVAHVLYDKPDRAYTTDEFVKAVQVQEKIATPAVSAAVKKEFKVNIPGNIARLTLDEIDAEVIKNGGSMLPPWVRPVIMDGKDTNDVNRWESRSEVVFAIACALVRAKVSDESIYAILTDKDYGISASILDKKNVEREGVRTIERAHEFCHEDGEWLCDMNRRHFVVACYGGKSLIANETIDPVSGFADVQYQSETHFRLRYSNRTVVIIVKNPKFDPAKPEHPTENPKTLSKTMPLAEAWLNHPLRRQYQSITFAPGHDIPDYYNLWTGYGVEPKPGDCSLWLDHVRQNVCGGDEAHYQYLVKWMARCAQRPGETGEVAVPIRGKEGTGKGMFARWFMKLFGKHGKHLTNPDHLTGKFNAHNADAVVIFADEAFFAGDKRHESVLKTLITEPTIMVERKGVDAISLPNYAHIIMASNNSWIVPASDEARRYFVLDIIADHMQDSEYFERITNQMKKGGAEALLFFLLGIDLAGFRVQDVPKTEGLRDQQEFSLEPDVAWWEAKLQAGELLTGLPWDKPCISKHLQDDYYEAVGQLKGRPKNFVRLSSWLRTMCFPPETLTTHVTATFSERVGARTYERSARMPAIQLPALDVCRAHWTKTRPNVVWLTPNPELKIDVDSSIPF